MSLIAWYPLDGNTEDYTVNQNHGVNNGVTWVNGKIGQAGSFNGSTSYILQNNNPITPETDLSFSCWFKTTSTTNQCIMSSRTVLGGGFSVFLLSGKLRIDSGTNYQWSTGFYPILNEWQHLVFTRDSSGRKIFINGSLILSDINPGDMTFLDTILSIGVSNTSGASFGNFFLGNINDVRIYDHALSQKEINDLVKAKVLHYTFNKDEDVVYDSSGYKRNGGKVGTPVVSTDTALGSNSMLVGLGNNAISFPSNHNLNIREAITINIWLKRTTGFNQTQDMFLVSRPPSWYFYDGYSSGTIRGEVFIDSVRQGVVQTPLPFDGNWYMITYTYDSNLRKSSIYKNGVLDNQKTLSGLSNYLIDASMANFATCGSATLGRGMLVDDIQIYATALSESDILDIYQTRIKIDNQGNLYANEIVEDYKINDTLTLNQLFTEKQLFANNEFNPLDGWNLVSTNDYTHNGNSLLVTQKSGYPNSQLSMSQFISYTVDHIYYFRANVLETDMADWFIYAPVQGSEYSYNFINVKSNNYTAYFSATNSGNYTTHIGRSVYFNGSCWKADHVVLFDLTAIFGAGNEPSREKMDIWYNDYTKSRPKSSGIMKTREFSEIDSPTQPMKIFKDKIQIQGSIKEG